MPYATIEQLRERIGSDVLTFLADADADGTGDTNLIEPALEDASAEIDTILAGRYETPVDPVPSILVRLAVDLAVYYIFLRSRGAITPEHIQRIMVARNLLGEIGRGLLDLDGAGARLRRLKCESTTHDQPRTFDRGSLDAY